MKGPKTSTERILEGLVSPGGLWGRGGGAGMVGPEPGNVRINELKQEDVGSKAIS